MLDQCRRQRRLFCLLLCLLAGVASQAQSPATTTISDTVYRADGTPAAGTLLISWPTFSTASGQAVAAGTKSVTLGAGGALSVTLVPNAGAAPANTYYVVVYQLSDGTVKTEFWSVETTSPTTIAAIRTTPGSGSSAAPPATKQYVDAAVATKANDSAVVHLSGAETITGTKQFAVAPSLPAPVQSGDAVNKAYVDSAVTTTSSGLYVSKSGDTMTGPLQLPADPTAPNQAADKHYVDTGLAVKANLINGVVPSAQLGNGTANSGVCLHGDSTWGGCGTSSNAVSIQNVPVDTTAPSDNQVITYVASLGKYQPANLKEFTTNVQMDGALTVAGAVTANSFVSTGTGPWSVTGSFGTLSTAAVGKSLLGFGTNGRLQVSENGGAVVEVAKLDVTGNFAGNATTASALAQTPTQCSNSFATGIQANGNANCSTADVIQLAETTPPAGIANYGLFWFDSTCHCPKVISNNGQAVQLGLLNVFNPDANTLEEYNGTNPQILRVYGTRPDTSNYERIGLKWDNLDGYFALASENAGTGTQRGIAFLIGSTVRWAVDTSSTWKPFTDNSFNIGSTTLRPKTVYAGTSFDISGSGAFTFEPCNDSTTGTSLNFLAKFNGASSPCAVKAGTGDIDGVIGVVSGGSGTSGNAVIAYRGYAQCSFDGGTTGGDYVVASITNPGDCHDAGAARPVGTQVIGKALSTNTGAGTFPVFTSLEPPAAGPSQIPWFTQPSASGTVSFLTSANVAKLYGVLYTSATPLTTTQVTYNVQTADNTANNYDIGLYNTSGSLVAHIGTTAGTSFAASTGWKTLSWTAAATIKQGRY